MEVAVSHYNMTLCVITYRAYTDLKQCSETQSKISISNHQNTTQISPSFALYAICFTGISDIMLFNSYNTGHVKYHLVVKCSTQTKQKNLAPLSISILTPCTKYVFTHKIFCWHHNMSYSNNYTHDKLSNFVA